MAIIYTQGFQSGKYRHGPVCLVDNRTAVVMIYHPDTKSNEAVLVAESQEKGAWVLGPGGPGDATLDAFSPGDFVDAEIFPTLQLLGENYSSAHSIETTLPRHLTKVGVLDVQ